MQLPYSPYYKYLLSLSCKSVQPNMMPWHSSRFGPEEMTYLCLASVEAGRAARCVEPWPIDWCCKFIHRRGPELPVSAFGPDGVASVLSTPN